MKYTIDRTKWYRGHDSAESRLLRRDGMMCCLGQVGEQCGLDREAMADVRAPIASEQRDRYPAWIMDNCTDPAFDSDHLMSINDDPAIGDEEREKRLSEVFAKHGDELEFIN